MKWMKRVNEYWKDKWLLDKIIFSEGFLCVSNKCDIYTDFYQNSLVYGKYPPLEDVEETVD